MNQETGGQAFPCEGPLFAERHDVYAYHGGMTLRDYFAAKAMQGFAADPQLGDIKPDLAAQAAYRWADAMLKEREK